MKTKIYDLQYRLIQFTLIALDIGEKLPKSFAGQHFSKQLIRSGSSPAFQYGEAQAAESRKDFIHKMKVGLKELRETNICLTIIQLRYFPESKLVSDALSECDELISIFYTSIATARRNTNK